MLKMLKLLRMPTIFEVQTTWVRSRTLILPQWPRQKKVGGGGPPRGVTIKSAAHRRWCRACWIHTSRSCQILLTSHFFFYLLSEKASGPLSFSLPSRPRIPQVRPKNPSVVSCWVILFDFLAFQNIVRKMLRKNIEKSAKIKDFGPQNPPKTLPKILPNGCFKKHVIFESVLDKTFQNSMTRNLENINFP